MHKTAFIVEGDLEQKFIQAICKAAPVQRLALNGDQVKIDAIVRRLDAQLRLLKRYSQIIVVFDREGRKETSQQISTEVMAKLKAAGHTAKIIVGVPDRTIENWCLADWERFCKATNTKKTQPSNVEGKHGKALIKTLMGGLKYEETDIGVTLLKAARPTKMSQKSASFKEFYSQLKIGECWWLSRD